jgi:hypothetical protein
MAHKLENLCPDGSSYPINLVFLDETGTEVAPTEVKWGLKNGRGETINDREDVEVGSLASSMCILTLPDDNRYSDGKSRYLTIKWKYDSSTLGNGIVMTSECFYNITDFKGIV